MKNLNKKIYIILGIIAVLIVLRGGWFIFKEAPYSSLEQCEAQKPKTLSRSAVPDCREIRFFIFKRWEIVFINTYIDV